MADGRTPKGSQPTVSLQQSDKNIGGQPFQFVESPKELTDFIDALITLPTWPPSMYIDLEGTSVSRQGTISLLQILASPIDRTYLIDIYSLGSKAFHTPGTDGRTTLKSILESNAILKVFFDVRRDSDALNAHFGIKLAGIHDLQLMELATRPPLASKKYLNGLAKCIGYDAGMTPQALQRWKAVKDKGVKLFAPERGGNYEVFNVRPLDEDMTAYCVQDVQFMPRLWNVYHAKITPQWAEIVEKATRNRVILSQSESFYFADGHHMKLGPWPGI
ncbi:MAG: hypothetical protein Q9166_002288 [cf. Caloplaca sp. 2 TL-2023]